MNENKFGLVSSNIAYLKIDNIDTDMIIPKQFLKTIKRTGLGEFLLYDMRYDMEGKKVDDFILNQDNYSNSNILLAGKNFGCGSSREHAPWSLKDFGIKVVIAESFADIFYNNCFKNAILPLILPQSIVEELFEYAKNPKNTLQVDLAASKITRENDNITYDFNIEESRKQYLLQGLDDISETLIHEELITKFEENQRKSAPWLYLHTYGN